MDKELSGLMGPMKGRTKRASGITSDTEVNKAKGKTGVTDSRRGSLSYAGMSVGSGLETRRTRSNSRTDRTTAEMHEQQTTEGMHSTTLDPRKQSIEYPLDNSGKESMTPGRSNNQSNRSNSGFGISGIVGEEETLGTVETIRTSNQDAGVINIDSAVDKTTESTLQYQDKSKNQDLNLGNAEPAYRGKSPSCDLTRVM